MGMLSSCIPKINGMRFHAFPANRVVRGLERMVRIDGNLFAIGKNGRIYTNGEMAGKVCYCGTSSDYSAVQAMLAFGLITQEDAKKHGEKKRLQDEAYEQYRAVTAEIEKLTSAGIKLTKAQTAKLADMKKNMNVKNLLWFVSGEAAKKLGLKD